MFEMVFANERQYLPSARTDRTRAGRRGSATAQRTPWHCDQRHHVGDRRQARRAMKAESLFRTSDCRPGCVNSRCCLSSWVVATSTRRSKRFACQAGAALGRTRVVLVGGIPRPQTGLRHGRRSCPEEHSPMYSLAFLKPFINVEERGAPLGSLGNGGSFGLQGNVQR